MRNRRRRILAASLPAVLGVFFLLQASWGGDPASLKGINLLSLEDPQIMGRFVSDRAAAIRLGKALFWDMQVGSDGTQACASCHFHAGSDSRAKNQLSPGLLAGDTAFGNPAFPQFKPNYTVKLSDFPFHRRLIPDDQQSPVIADSNDVVSSQGVFLTRFQGLASSRAGFQDQGTPGNDPVFHVAGKTVRRVEPRNAPTVINAALNFSNFHDGRANNIFNGVNPFGHLDPGAAVFENAGGQLVETPVRLSNSSLASQAVGPPLSDFEMSFAGRTFAELGRKILSVRPLAKQSVHPQDSVLGPLSAALAASGRGRRGLETTYRSMVQAAFRPEWWGSDQVVRFTRVSALIHPASAENPRTFPLGSGSAAILPSPGRLLAADEFTQMEANFSLFFGLALQLYQSTLVSDDTPFDRFAAGTPGAMSAEAVRGLGVFTGKGKCANCHGGSALTNHSLPHILGLDPRNPGEPEGEGVVELMNMATGSAFYDSGIYNIAVTPTGDDIGRGGTVPVLNPLTGQNYPLSFSRLATLKRDGRLPPEVAAFTADLPPGAPSPPDRVAVEGAFKTPGLRNIELTGPYFHNGSAATLMQVVDFYSRGGNFPGRNILDLDVDIVELGLNVDEKRELVAFMLALTDDRVRNEAAPFDHPELFIPDGQRGNETAVPGSCQRVYFLGFSVCDEVRAIPAVGAAGRQASGLSPIQPFLNEAGDPNFHFRP